MPNNDFTHGAYQNFLNNHLLMGSHCLSCGATYLAAAPDVYGVWEYADDVDGNER
ncbi:MAG: hypothetical protein HC806_03065 [Anaerolineae bacterium]|nr:hypothetical protein [Anaerolineae bacterium]